MSCPHPTGRQSGICEFCVAEREYADLAEELASDNKWDDSEEGDDE